MRLNFLKNNIILIYIKPHLKSILNNERRYSYENNSGEAINSRCIQTVRNILVCSRWRRIWIGRRIFYILSGPDCSVIREKDRFFHTESE